MTTNEHLDDELGDTLRKIAGDLGQPTAALVIFNEDGDPAGQLRTVDFYGPDGVWQTSVDASGQVNTPDRDESAAWSALTDLWESGLPEGQRVRIR